MPTPRHADLSGIADKDLTQEQAKELQRRFQAFTRALAMAKTAGPSASKKKTVKKWAPPARSARS